MVEKKSKKLSMRRQCELLGLARSGVYKKAMSMSSKNLELMSQIDAQYMKTPYYGSPKMTVHLRQMGYVVNIKRIKRLMRLMGISAIHRGPKTSQKNNEHKVYPYLLKNLEIKKPKLEPLLSKNEPLQIRLGLSRCWKCTEMKCL